MLHFGSKLCCAILRLVVQIRLIADCYDERVIQMIDLDELIMMFRKKGITSFFNEPVQIKKTTGIVFYYAVWAPSTLNLEILLENITPDLTLYIYDIDTPYFNSYIEEEVGTGTGWGDIFWLKKGKVLKRVNGFKNREEARIIINNLNKQLK